MAARRRAGRREGDESGLAVVELLLWVLAIGAMLDFVVFCAQVPKARAQVDKAAIAAAQEASVHRSPEAARAAALSVAVANLDQDGVACLNPDVGVDASDWQPGGLVRVTVACDLDVSALQLLPFPGRQRVTTSFVAPIDTHKVLAG